MNRLLEFPQQTILYPTLHLVMGRIILTTLLPLSLQHRLAHRGSTSPPPKEREQTEATLTKVAPRSGPKSAEGRNHFETVFKEALEGGHMEVVMRHCGN